jgi:hypothetical protein
MSRGLFTTVTAQKRTFDVGKFQRGVAGAPSGSRCSDSSDAIELGDRLLQ